MVPVVGTVVFIALAAVLLLAIARRDRLWGESAWPELDSDHWSDDGEDDLGDGAGGVREPRRPLPSGGAASVAVEPEERAA